MHECMCIDMLNVDLLCTSNETSDDVLYSCTSARATCERAAGVATGRHGVAIATYTMYI